MSQDCYVTGRLLRIGKWSRAEKWHMVLGEFCRILRIFEAAHSPRGNSMRICYVYASALAPAAASTTGPDNALALKPDEDRIAPVGMRRANSQNSCRAWRAYVSSRVSTHMFQVLTFRHMTRCRQH